MSKKSEVSGTFPGDRGDFINVWMVKIMIKMDQTDIAF